MNSSAARHYDKSSWWVLGANSIILKHWSDCLCHVALGRTENRTRSPRWTASSFWVYAGKGSGQIRSVTLEKGLAQRVTWDAINYCFVWYCVMQLIRVGVVTPRLGNTKRCLRLITNFELKRTRRILLFNKNIALWWGESPVHTMWFLPSASNINMEKFKQVQVNGGSNYDPRKVAKCLVI